MSPEESQLGVALAELSGAQHANGVVLQDAIRKTLLAASVWLKWIDKRGSAPVGKPLRLVKDEEG